MKNSTKLLLTGLGLAAVGTGVYYVVKKYLPETQLTEELKEVIETATETVTETATEATGA